MSAVSLVSHEQEVDVEVRREDQMMINEFGRLNVRKHEIQEEQTKLKESLQHLDDALTELMMASTPLELYIGESLVQVDETYASEFLEARQTKLEETESSLQAELNTIKDRQELLKKVLYGRFGNSINLEEK